MNYFQKALQNDEAAILAFLKEGNKNITDDLGASLLHYAARGNAIAVAKILIDSEIDINICDNNGETALFEVVRTGKLDFVRLLLKHNANLNIVNRFGETLLFRAIIKGNETITELLLSKGNYDFSITNHNGENLLFYALKAQNTSLFMKYAKLYPNLLKVCNHHGCNLLMFAVKLNNHEAIDYLLKSGFNYYQLDKSLNNVFSYSAQYGDYETVNQLLALKPILTNINSNKHSVMDLVKENANHVENLFDNYLHSSEYKFYLRTYPFHAAVIARNYDLLDVCPISIKKRDSFNISLVEYMEMVNDDNMRKIFKSLSQ